MLAGHLQRARSSQPRTRENAPRWSLLANANKKKTRVRALDAYDCAARDRRVASTPVPDGHDSHRLYRLWPIAFMAYIVYGLYRLWPIAFMAYTVYGL